MTTVAVRELRNNTARVIQKAREGETVILTSRGEQVAQIVPIKPTRRLFMTRDELMAIPQTDPGLREDLARMGDDETDFVGYLG
jgi:prevent-host-death family protein